MGSSIPNHLASLLAKDLKARADDPRVGSSRDNSTSTSALKAGTGSNSSSFSTLFMTFVPVAVYAAICLLIFLSLRSRYPRAYAPRTFLDSLEPHERIKQLPRGWFKWVRDFYKVPDATALTYSSLDGYLFLRFLKILCVIFGVGCLMTWVILLPLHRYGGGTGEQLDMLTFANVVHPQWYFVHAFLAWIYFGFILYMISRECVYFVNLRQAYILSPFYAERLSSRTVLYTSVPRRLLDERKLKTIFGDAAKNVWIPRDTTELDILIKEREQTAERLERAEILLIKKANIAYQKALKTGHPDIAPPLSPQDSKEKEMKASVESGSSSWPRSERTNSNEILPSDSTMPPKELVQTGSDHTKSDDIMPSESTLSPREFLRIDGTPGNLTSYGASGPPDVNGSIAAQWIPHSMRPVHRPLANFGRRADTIKWSRNQLKELAPKISKLRRQHKKGQTPPIAAAFVEFDSQANAQSAYQTLAHHRANHMVAEIIGVRPREIIWESLRMEWWQRIIKRFLIQGLVAAMVIFWSLPCALIGMISNVKFLSDNIFFLHWIPKLPSVVLGIIEGLVPAVALSLLMSAVPIIMRWCARQAGIPTIARVELFTQSSYFLFQVVQVFLITTLTSAASASLMDILKDPLSLRSLLAANLPKASNFYISYFILQGLAMSGTRIAHVGSLWRFYFTSNKAGTPRIVSKRYHRLRIIHWGAIYPVFTNMGVIAISYSLIAPIVLGVAFIGMFIIYASYRYNILYVYSAENDTRGLHYPRALSHLLTGLYFAEICLIGLLGISGSFGALVLMFGLTIFTFLINISLNSALSPLLSNLPRTLAVEEELLRTGCGSLDDIPEKEPIDPEDPDMQNPYDSDFDPSQIDDAAVEHDPNPGIRGVRMAEGTGHLASIASVGVTAFLRMQYRKSSIPRLITKVNFWSRWTAPDPDTPKPSFFLKWLHPEIFADYAILKSSLPKLPEIEYEAGATKDAYHPPSVRVKAPKLWIPKDAAGVSAQEVRHTSKVIAITDEGATIDERNRMTMDITADRREGWEKVRY